MARWIAFLVLALALWQGVARADGPSTEQLSQALTAQLAAADAQHRLERGQLQNQETRAQADYQKQHIACGNNRGCQEEAVRQYQQQLREIEKQRVDADMRWRIARARILVANQVAGLGAGDTEADCIRPVTADALKQRLAAADARHVQERERLQEREYRAQADYQKAHIDCSAQPGSGAAACDRKAVAALEQARREIAQARVDVDEAWREARNTAQTEASVQRMLSQADQDKYRAGVQAGVGGCIAQAASPLWTDNTAGIRIGTALAAGRIAALANMAGLAAVPGTLVSLKAVLCGPPAPSQNVDPYARGQEDGEAYCKWAGSLAAGGIARSRAPLLAVAPEGATMLKEALGYLKQAAPAQRIGLFQQFADQIAAATGGSWTASRVDLEGGGAIFAGEAGEALVFDPAGQMFRGRVGNLGTGPDAQFNFGPGGTLVPNYPKLRPIQ
jgi:hypothetical protein